MRFNVVFLVLLLFSVVFCSEIYATKQLDVTQFLGFPVDGTRSEMVEQLKNKGFVENLCGDYLEGEFNGEQVKLYIHTNKIGLVWRIMLVDRYPRNVYDIVSRYNMLCEQFDANEKYNEHYLIENNFKKLEDEGLVPYVFIKRGASPVASFYQNVDYSKYTAPDIPEEEFYWDENIDSLKQELEYAKQYVRKYGDIAYGPDYDLLDQHILDSVFYYQDELQSADDYACSVVRYQTVYHVERKHVWFTLKQKNDNNEFFIVMYYDNEYNRTDATGEDL